MRRKKTYIIIYIFRLQDQWGWKRPLGTSSPTSDQPPPRQPDHGTECYIYSFLKHFQVQWLYHLPEQCIPISSHTFCEEIIPNLQFKRPLGRLRLCLPVCHSFSRRRDWHPPVSHLLSGSFREWSVLWISYTTGCVLSRVSYSQHDKWSKFLPKNKNLIKKRFLFIYKLDTWTKIHL